MGSTSRHLLIASGVRSVKADGSSLRPFLESPNGIDTISFSRTLFINRKSTLLILKALSLFSAQIP